ncbi:hypothetical protein AaE_016015, partial [Aphanomyces astaci]
MGGLWSHPVHYSKVPLVTEAYWPATLSASGVGDALSAFLSVACDFGGPSTLGMLSFIFVCVLVSELSLRQYAPGMYWLVFVGAKCHRRVRRRRVGRGPRFWGSNRWVDSGAKRASIMILTRTYTEYHCIPAPRGIHVAAKTALDSTEGTVLFGLVVPGLVWKCFKTELSRDVAFWMVLLVTRPFELFGHTLLTAPASVDSDDDSNLWAGSFSGSGDDVLLQSGYS